MTPIVFPQPEYTGSGVFLGLDQQPIVFATTSQGVNRKIPVTELGLGPSELEGLTLTCSPTSPGATCTGGSCANSGSFFGAVIRDGYGQLEGRFTGKLIEFDSVQDAGPLSCTYVIADQFGHQASLVAETANSGATPAPAAPLSSLGSGIITFDLPSTDQAPLTLGNNTPQIEIRAHEDGYVGPFVFGNIDDCPVPDFGSGSDGILFDQASGSPGSDVFVIQGPTGATSTTTCTNFKVSDMNGNSVTYPIRVLVPGTTPASRFRRIGHK